MRNFISAENGVLPAGSSAGPALAPRDAQLGVAALIDSIGTEQFAWRLLALLHQVCGAKHFAAFQLGPDAITALAFSSLDCPQIVSAQVTRYVKEGWWRRDPVITLARQCMRESAPSLIQMKLDPGDDAELRQVIYPHVRDAVMVCGRRGDAFLGLSILSARPNPEFAAGALLQLKQLADTLVSVMAKHASVSVQLPNAARALTDLLEIENCFLARSALPKRELEVCARVLRGISTVGISLDLGIGEESVRTYRKRAYQRMGIGSERELLQWYLDQWSHWRRCRVNWISPSTASSHVH